MNGTARERERDWKTYLREGWVWFLVAGQLTLLIPRGEDEAALYYQRDVALAPVPRPHLDHQHSPESHYTATSPVRSDRAQVTSRSVVHGAASAGATTVATATATVVKSGFVA